MKSVLKFAGGLFFLAVLSAASPVHAQEFSADVWLVGMGNKIEGKVYVKEDSVRMEINQAIMISIQGGQHNYLLNPAAKIYKELPQSQAPRVFKTLYGETEREFVEKNNLDGVDTDKYKVTLKQPDGTILHLKQWVMNDKITIALQVDEVNVYTRYMNINSAPQPAELFELPKDYQEVK